MFDGCSAHLVIRLFGPCEVLLHGQPLPRLRSRKGLWLLALLALRAGRDTDRAWLAGTLWPDSSEAAAFANLRSTLKDLRRALGSEAARLPAPEETPRGAPRSLRLDLEGVEVDVLAFDAAIAAGDPASLERAVSLYRGPLLEEYAEAWALPERERWEQAFLRTLERLAEDALDRGDSATAEGHLRRAATVDPLRESTQRGLMRTLAAGGNVAMALQVYRDLRLLLQRELNAAPDPETVALFESLRSSSRFAARGSQREKPSALTSVGRQTRSSGCEPRAASYERPEGTVTFLFTDIEGSTRLWERHPGAMRQALARHDAMAATVIEQYGGTLVKSRGEGDSLFAVFARATDALAAACTLQQVLHAEPWPAEAPLRVRMALHTGEADRREGDYYGPAVNRCARLRAIAHGGQVLLSLATEEVVRDALPEGASLLDLGLCRLQDLSQPEHVFQLAHPHLPADFPPLKSLEALPNNLPLQLTSFIGREEEMAAVRRHLTTSRLVTLTGVGGCGKTRLALQVAADLLTAYADGVWLVELAALSDPTLVPHTVAAALGVQEATGRPLLATLVEYLRTRALLLVLDNCEHLLFACAQLAEGLLQRCPHLRVLASSREALGIAGEQALPVPSLSLPVAGSRLLVAGKETGPGSLPTTNNQQLTTLLQYEAIRLFTDRAALSQPAFVLTEANAAAVAQVCQRLDGIPLAIELAAARVKALPVEQIAVRLDDRFRLLTGGSRTALPRQQTLRALIDWSYDLLSDPERLLLRRLSVFSGGWTLEVAEAVCSDDERRTTNDQRGSDSVVGRSSFVVGRDEVLDLLTTLVEKCLVHYEERDGKTRYRLLETVRQYARDRLLEAGEAASGRERHLEFFLTLAERAEPELHGPDQVRWLGELELEHDNLRAALEWSKAEAHGPEKGLRLAGALWWFWALHRYWQEGNEWLTALLSMAGPTLRTSTRALALYAVGELTGNQGDREQAARLFQESLALFKELGDKRGMALSLYSLARQSLFEPGRVMQGDPKSKVELFEESLALAREVGDRWVRSQSLLWLGFEVWQQGDLQRATTFFDEGLASSQELGDKRTIGYFLSFLGQVAWQQGNPGRAIMLLEQSLPLFQELGDKTNLAEAPAILGRMVLRRGDHGRAATLGEESLALAREIGDKYRMVRALHHLGDLALVQGDCEQAIARYEEGLILSRENRGTQMILASLRKLGTALAAQGHCERAARLFGAAEALRATISYPVLLLAEPLGPAESLEYEQQLAAVRNQLGEATFTARWAEGRAMVLEDAVADATGGTAEA